MATVYNFLNPDSTEIEEQRIISAPGATTGDVLTVAANGTVSPAPGGGPQPIDPISPDAVTGLALWLKADAIVGKSDGDPVTTWEDQSGNNRDAAANMGEEPIYRTNVQNGLPALHFDPLVPQYFDVPDAKGIFRNVSGGTWIAVCSPTPGMSFGDSAVIWFSDGASADIIRASLYAGPGAFLSASDAVDGDNQIPRGGGTNTQPWAFTAANGLNAFGATIDISGASTVGRTRQSWWEGVVLGALQGAVGTTPDTDSDHVCVGAATTDHDGFDGYIAELAVWPLAVTPDELDGLVQYLINKYAPVTP